MFLPRSIRQAGDPQALSRFQHFLSNTEHFLKRVRATAGISPPACQVADKAIKLPFIRNSCGSRKPSNLLRNCHPELARQRHVWIVSLA